MSSAAADVVHDQVTLSRLVPEIRYHADVSCAATQVPRDDISRQVTVTVITDADRFPFTFEIGLQIRHTPVIDVCFAKCAHDHVRADACFDRHVTVWVIEALVGGIITRRLSNLIDGPVNYEFEIWRAACR